MKKTDGANEPFKRMVSRTYRTLDALTRLHALVNSTAYAEDVLAEINSILVPAIQARRDELEKMLED